MRFVDQLRSVAAMPRRLAGASLASPWAADPSHLASIVYKDIFGDTAVPAAMTRAEAMSVPAVARGRHLVAGTIGRLPLAVYRGEDTIDTPGWIDRSDADLSPFHRMLWTTDDLIFHGWSLWSVIRGGDGLPTRADRVPFDDWTFEDDATGATVIAVNGRVVARDSVCLIPGMHEGLLAFAARTIRHASMLVDAADRAAETPTPNVELHQTTAAPMTHAEITELVNQWAAARRGKNGGVAYTNAAIEARFHGEVSAQLLIEGRNAAAVDIARSLGIPASMIDATGPESSLTYETTNGRNSEFVDYGLAPYMAAITARLGMDDMLPRGQRIEFDLENYTGTALASLGTQDDDNGLPPATPHPVPDPTDPGVTA